MAAGLVGAFAGRTGDDLDRTTAYRQVLFSAWAVEENCAIARADLLLMAVPQAGLNAVAD